MVSSSIDHMVAVIAFLAALLLFIGLFNQTIQTAVIYQRHKALATKASDLLDAILLNPGVPSDWSISDGEPAGFGLQNPEFTQYQLSPFSLMRLVSSVGESRYYNVTEQWYSNVTIGDRTFLLVPYGLALNYSTVAKLLGVNNTYGFQLSITPIVSISIAEAQVGSSLTLDVAVSGAGSPLSNAALSYCFLKVGSHGNDPYYSISFNNGVTDDAGLYSVTFSGVGSKDSYAFIVYAHVGGLVGMGFHQRTNDNEEYVVPFIESFDEGKVLLAHSYNVHEDVHPESAVFYNATYVVLTEDFTLRNMPVSTDSNKVVYGHGSQHTFGNLTIGTSTPGILVVTYKTQGANRDGVVLMPWGVSSLAFPVVFGLEPSQQEWVATDMRLVTVDGLAYQAKLALWSLEGYQVMG